MDRNCYLADSGSDGVAPADGTAMENYDESRSDRLLPPRYGMKQESGGEKGSVSFGGVDDV